MHFEIIGKDPPALRGFFQKLFGWECDTSGTVADVVSEPTNYVVFYVGVPDVAAALHTAEVLGGQRQFGPATAPNGLVIGHFTDPEGNLIGLASST